jgi:hypothetical protein
MSRPTNQLRELATLGAEVRLRELQSEIASLYAAFPALQADGPRLPRGLARRRVNGTGGSQPMATAGTTNIIEAVAEQASVPEPARTRPRRRWTAAQRRAVAVRMRKYWAGRRKSKK